VTALLWLLAGLAYLAYAAAAIFESSTATEPLVAGTFLLISVGAWLALHRRLGR
jgi:hypothetical protein